MGRYYRKKEHNGRTENVRGHFDEGSCARTRPFSFDEIMSRRKKRKELEILNQGASGDISVNVTVDNASDDHKPKKGSDESKDILAERVYDRYVSETIRGKDSSIQIVSDHYKSERGDARSKDSFASAERSLSERHVKTGARKEEERTSNKDDSLQKGKHRKICDSETIVAKGKMERDLRVEARGRHGEKYHGRRQSDEQSSKSFQSGKKHSRDTQDKDRNGDRRIEESERDNKKKYPTRVDEKHKDNNHSKHDLEKMHGLDSSRGKERKEPLKLHHDDTRLKRRRSRSQERESRKRISSVSFSPRAHNTSSYDAREHRDLSSSYFKERSGWQHSNNPRSTIVHNGSSSHRRKYGGSTSGLGGYSPRKRRTDVAIKTPSPRKRSPEKKSAKWDITPEGTNNTSSVAVPSNVQPPNKSASLNVHEVTPATPVAPIVMKPFSGIPPRPMAINTNISIDSIQLTQATRPMRRLYVENVPTSTSEKDMMQCLNSFLISSGINHIKGTQPCISCIINKEKGQAVVEFLTPEDASAALSFDGSTLSGSIIKIRRPKDFVEVATGPTIKMDKSEAPVEAISDIVKDSPYKLFIGGISRTLSPKMLMEIASAFGPLKAYQFEKSGELDEAYAFLEYADQSIMLKACAGLNGMKLGGRVITAVQALQNGSFEENSGNPSFYGIPEHAKPLLENPMHVLKLKNVFDPEALPLLSDTEIEEIMDDVRLECSRFGMVKSLNLVKCNASSIFPSEACEAVGDRLHTGDQGSSGCNVMDGELEIVKQGIESEGNNTNSYGTVRHTELNQPGITDGDIAAEDPANLEEANSDEVPQQGHTSNNKSGGDGDETSDHSQIKDVNHEEVKLGAVEELNSEEIFSQELPEQLPVTTNESDRIEDKIALGNQFTDNNKGNKIAAREVSMQEGDGNFREHSVDDSVSTRSKLINKIYSKEDHNLEHIFEPASVFVEFGRTEASCMAAHCLHGRIFDDRVVTVGYVPLGVYRARFLK